MEGEKLSILIVGATGHLGSLITRETLKCDKLLVNILIRDTAEKSDLIDEVQNKGGKVIKVDVKNFESFKGATKGIHTVISTVIGDDKVIIEGQDHLLNDAVENGVKRFVPSDFSIDYSQLQGSNNLLARQRWDFRQKVESKNIKGLYIHSGLFLETYIRGVNYLMENCNQIGCNVQKHDIPYWGNPDQKIDFSTYEDTAKYVAYAVANPDRTGDLYLRTAGELSTNDISKIYSKVVGQEVGVMSLGTIEDLNKLVENKKAELQHKQQEGDILHFNSYKDMFKPEFFWGVFLEYFKFIFEGIGKFNQNNISEFPEVKPWSFEEFLNQNNNERFKFDQHESLGATLSNKKDQLFNRMEDAVEYLTKNLNNVSEDLKCKLKNLVSGTGSSSAH